MAPKTSVLLTTLFLILGFTAVMADEEPLIFYGNEPELRNNIILTIDDASIEDNVRSLFEVLQAHHITATWFPNTRYLQQQDAHLWQQMVAAGFEIGYHTRNHTPGMTPEQLTADFALFQAEIRTVLNDPLYTIRYVRPPDGLWNEDWLSWAEASQLITVRWNVTTLTADMAYLEAVLKNRTRGGSIILLHTSEDDIQWLKSHLPTLLAFVDDQQVPYQITNLSHALTD